jgi:hypothetical protein
MRFYIPEIGDGEAAEHALLAMRQAAQLLTKRAPTDRRVHAVQFWLGKKQFDAEVGKPLTQLGLRHDQKGEAVIAILETRDPDSFLVFTSSWSSRKGQPLVVPQEDSFMTLDFDKG